MSFGENLKEIRLNLGIALKELSRKSEVSASYISTLENEEKRIPSVDIIFKLTYGLFQIDKFKNQYSNGYMEILYRLINSPSLNYSSIDKQMILLAFTDFINNKDLHLNNEFQKINENYFANKIQINKTTDTEKSLEYPFFDIEWLLKQKKFKLFYGRDYLINKTNKPLEYNVLNDEDIEIITGMIKAYIKNRYPKINDPETYFNEISPYYTDSVEAKMLDDFYQKNKPHNALDDIQIKEAVEYVEKNIK